MRFWKIRTYKGKRGRTYSVRWTVAGHEFHQTYSTSTLAESRLAELRTFARNGVAFDVATGLPVPEIRQTQVQAEVAGLRPSEAVELRIDRSLDLPNNDGWGTLYLRESAPTVGSAWSASGRRRDPRQLKHRAEEEVRPVPCHPVLTGYIHRHIEEFGTAPDGRLFRGERGGDLSESVYGRAWQGARLLAFTPAVADSSLARRPYDLRHACLSRSETRFRAVSRVWAAGSGRGWEHLEVLLPLAYRLVRCLFGLLAVLVRSDLSKDIELLVLRHENQVLRRQLSGPPDIETQPVRDVADLRPTRRKPVVAGVINEYHHAA